MTEWGRQPYAVRGILTTAEAVTPVTGLLAPFVGFALLYLFLGAVTATMLWRQIVREPHPAAEPA